MTTATALALPVEEILQDLGDPAATANEIAQRIIESAQTVRFVWHCWVEPLNNLDGDGYKYGVHQAALPARKLIWLPIYRNPVIRASSRRGQFGLSALVGDAMNPEFGFAAPSQGTPARAETRDQLPAESVGKLSVAYGRFGLVALESLTAQTRAEKARAAWLYHAVMEAPEVDGEGTGQEIVLEDMADWLSVAAPRRLRRAIARGFEGGASVPPEWLGIGEQMIADLRRSVAAIEVTALDADRGILRTTAEQLAHARMGQHDNKIRPDRLDQKLLVQFPSVELNTEVERAVNLVRRTQAEAQAPQHGVDPLTVELSYWDSIKHSDDPLFFTAYLEEYPDGKFAKLARLKAQPKQTEKPIVPAPEQPKPARKSQPTA